MSCLRPLASGKIHGNFSTKSERVRELMVSKHRFYCVSIYRERPLMLTCVQYISRYRVSWHYAMYVMHVVCKLHHMSVYLH